MLQIVSKVVRDVKNEGHESRGQTYCNFGESNIMKEKPPARIGEILEEEVENQGFAIYSSFIGALEMKMEHTQVRCL